MKKLSGSQLDLLKALSWGSTTESGIKRALDFPRGGVGRTIRALVARGFIERCGVPIHNGHITFDLPGFKITELGRKALEHARG